MWKRSLDLHLHAAQVPSVMLCSHVQVDELLTNLHTKLTQIQFNMTKTGTLRTLRTLAGHHLSPFLTSLLHYPVPYSR